MNRPEGRQTDEELMVAFQAGDDNSFTELVNRFKDPLINFAFRHVGDWDECYDIVQETFVRVYRSGHTYKPLARPSTWIYTICLNLCRTTLRRRKVWMAFRPERRSETVGTDREPVDDGHLPDRLADSSLLEKKVQEALSGLDEKFREVVILRDIQELSYEEIADVTGLNIGTVKSRINRGRQYLQEQLKDFFPEE